MIHPDFTEAPNRSGVYLLYSGGTCIYVGSAARLLRRFRSHKLRYIADGWEWREVPIEHLAQEEQVLIDTLNPPMNVSRVACRKRDERPTQKVPSTISLEDTLLAQLDAYAQSIGETRSVVVRRAIRELLKRAKKAE